MPGKTIVSIIAVTIIIICCIFNSINGAIVGSGVAAIARPPVRLSNGSASAPACTLRFDSSYTMDGSLTDLTTSYRLRSSLLRPHSTSSTPP